MNEATIMPDGRPLFAWQNELEMLRTESQRTKQALEEYVTFKQIMGVVMERRQDFETLNWLIRIRMSDAVTANDFKYNLAKYLHIEPVQSN